MCKLLEKMLSAPRAKQKNNLQIKVVINILTRRIGLGVGLVGWTSIGEFRLEQMSDLYRTSSKDLGIRLIPTTRSIKYKYMVHNPIFDNFSSVFIGQ